MAEIYRFLRGAVPMKRVDLALAALLFCLLWYAGQVVARQLTAPLRPASDVYWGLAEPRDPRSV